MRSSDLTTKMKVPHPMREAARNLRKAPTRSEELLWAALRKRRLAGKKFRRQHAIGRFVVDFYCDEEQIAVEIDGGIHQEQRIADAERQRILEAAGIRFVRISTTLVEDDIFAALKLISKAFDGAPSPALRERDGSPKANLGEG